MANQRAAAALLLIVSLFVAAAISGAHARPSKMATFRRDAHELKHDETEEEGAPETEEERAPEPEEEPQPEPEKEPHPDPEPKERKPKSELTCHKVYAVKEDDSCRSVWKRAELSEDQFLSFNPSLRCENIFVGQWFCLEATFSCNGGHGCGHGCPGHD